MPDRYDAARREAHAIAEAIRRAGAELSGEPDLRSRVAHALVGFAERNNIPLETREEYTLASGRPDTIYNRLVIEYKAPGTLSRSRRHRKTEDAIVQLQGYLDTLANRDPERPQRFAGVVVDGRLLIFIRIFPNTRQVDPPVEVTDESVELALRYLISMSGGAAILPETLVKDFGIDKERAQHLVAAFYGTLTRSRDPLVSGLYRQWELYFTEVAGYEVGSTQFLQKPGVRDLVKTLGAGGGDVSPARLFFALHTYYALLIKLIAWVAVTPYIGRLGTTLGRLAEVSRDELKQRLQDLERGGIFRQLGIRNFLEGDFFGWYLEVWNDEVFAAVREVVIRLSEYDPGTLSLNPNGTRDLLKKLYQFLVPREVRHDLGEYYTPDWLAQLTLNRLEGHEPYIPFTGDPDKRILDPACGSGTFLVLAINAIKRTCQERMLSEKETLDRILSAVVGIDLNPLAVISARTNYLLAIQDLLEHRTADIAIPVYLADSIKVPSVSQEVPTFGNVMVPTAVGTFAVPPAVANKSDMEFVANLIDECVESDVPTSSFLERARAGLIGGKFDDAKVGLTALYDRVLDLHRQGMNGIWSRILKNAFAPLFIGNDFDYIIGNPPWVNWESLPEDYRTQTKPLWVRYGLFPHSGMATILGKGKKDISMLMTYAVADRHLRDGGRLAFVITQTVFKTAGAAQGFRRFRLGDHGAHLRAVHVDDMTELNPFEGATNRTAIMVLEKGRATSPPVPYTIWAKSGRGSISFDATLGEVLESTIPTVVGGKHVDPGDPTSAWLTGTPEVLEALGKVLGKASYVAHAGSYTGGANAVYWVEILRDLPAGLALCRNITEGAKREVEQLEEVALERELLHPLLRGRDVIRWRGSPSASILLVQDPATRRGLDEALVQTKYPRSYAYLKRFESALRDRRDRGTRGIIDKGGPFYSFFGVGSYTMSAWKVVWREVANEVDAAVVGPRDARVVIPDHTLIFVPFEDAEEAHYFCALINSAPAHLLVRNVIVLHPDPHILEKVRIPRFDRTNPIHTSLAKLSQLAHEAAANVREAELREVEEKINTEAAVLWGIGSDQMRDIKLALRPA